jgi:hypothetical protein
MFIVSGIINIAILGKKCLTVPHVAAIWIPTAPIARCAPIVAKTTKTPTVYPCKGERVER